LRLASADHLLQLRAIRPAIVGIAGVLEVLRDGAALAAVSAFTAGSLRQCADRIEKPDLEPEPPKKVRDAEIGATVGDETKSPAWLVASNNG
jgi:hypothetical protein